MDSVFGNIEEEDFEKVQEDVEKAHAMTPETHKSQKLETDGRQIGTSPVIHPNNAY